MSDTISPRSRSRFGEQVRRELDRQRMSIRQLARLLDPDNPNAARRNLARWIGGYHQPSRINRIAVAEALGLAPEALLEDDEEEADPVAALMDALRRVVREEHEVALRRVREELLGPQVAIEEDGVR